MSNYYYKNSNSDFAPKILILSDGRKVINPTASMYAEYGYLPYTPPKPSEEEIAERERQAQIDLLKMRLQESDYKAIKYAEGWISDEDYAPIKAERQSLRDEINELEDKIQTH